jgi:enoyl-CoA hydratase/carnithine racemase
MTQSLIYTGQTLPVKDALGVRLIDEVVAADGLLSRAHELARGLASIPQHVFELTKRSLRAETLERIEKAKALQDQTVSEIWAAPETHERIRDYLRRTVGK